MLSMQKRLVLPLLILALVFSATGTQAQGGDSTLDRVQEDDAVRIGVRFDNPPLSFIDEDGNWIGFDVDLANEIAERLEVDIEMVRVDELTRISFLQEGQIDLAVASMNHTRSRDEAVDFSITYFWDSQTFLVREGEFDSLDDMFGKVVAMNAGSSAIDAWKRYVEAQGGASSEIVEFTDKVAAVQALRDGAVDGYAEDGITLAALASGDDSLVLLSEGFNPVQYGVGVPENDSEWRDAINYVLQDIWTDGTYFDIYDLWLGPDAEVSLPLGGEMEIWR
jgi:polar amino acid transport system substrate-binding protein